MPIEGLESAQLKLEHAGRHLDSLNATVLEYVDSGGFTIGVRWKQDHPDYSLIAYVKNAIPVPDLIALQAADFVGNLRAALDHSIYDHVVKKAIDDGTPLTKNEKTRVKFPILENPKSIENPDWYASAVLQAIEKHQPHHHKPAQEHPLAQLNRMVNHDKHRVSLVTSSTDLEQDLQYKDPFVYVGHEEAAIGAKLKPGIQILRADFLATKPLEKHPHEYAQIVDGGFYAAIEIPGTEQRPPILPMMGSLRDYVATVLEDLKKAGVK